MTIFVLDTNIISHLLKNDGHVLSMFNAELEEGNMCVIPPIAYYEIKRGLLAVNASVQLRLFENLCRELSIGRMEIKMWDEAANLYVNLRRLGNLIEDADLFIAAFCIVGGYTLVTGNTKHFDRIPALKYVNWKL
jgi:tRNA(fMet)-specific endonuclease VapC